MDTNKALVTITIAFMVFAGAMFAIATKKV